MEGRSWHRLRYLVSIAVVALLLGAGTAYLLTRSTGHAHPTAARHGTTVTFGEVEVSSIPWPPRKTRAVRKLQREIPDAYRLSRREGDAATRRLRACLRRHAISTLTAKRKDRVWADCLRTTI